jgi:DNA-binding response OmpR family regulator
MKGRILVVDDDQAVRESLQRVLTMEGYQAVPAADGEEAVKIATATKVDLVLLDLNMPRKNGWDAFEQLTHENPLLPIIVITAREDQLFTSLAAGVGGLMEKPLDFPKLLRAIGGLLHETPETHLARITGESTGFHYFPARNQTKS